MRKKIAHIVNSKIYSGLEKVAINIIEKLEEEYEFIYVTQNGPIVDVLKEKKINYYIIDNLKPANIRRFVKEWKPDLIHAHDFTAMVQCSLSKINIPIIGHIHNNAPWIKRICIKSFAFLYAALKLDKILTVSQSIENEYVFSKYISKKIQCVSNPISYNEISKYLNIKIEKKYDICCVGRITEAKDPLRFVRIINLIKKELNNLKVVWVGDGELKEELELSIRKNGLEETIDLVGYKKNPYDYMQMSRVFMLTSIWEGFGLAAYEAMALGLPCYVSNVGGLPDLISSDCGMICKNDDDYIKGIIKQLSDSTYYMNCANSAILHAKELDNTKTYYEMIKKVYED